MASRLTNENTTHLSNPKIISYKNFKKLDNIGVHDDNVLVLDYTRNSGIHVLNKSLEYIGNITCRERYALGLTVLRNNQIGILQTYIFSIYEKVSTSDGNMRYEKVVDLDIPPMKSAKRNDLCGLCSDFASEETVFFIEKPSRQLGWFKNRIFGSKKFSLPKRFKNPGVRDLKIYNNRFFLTDYKYGNDDGTPFGNDCVHVFDNELRYITSFGEGEIKDPQCLIIEPHDKRAKIYVCEFMKVGSIKVYNYDNNEGEENFQLVETIQLNDCSFPYYICSWNDQLFVTQNFRPDDTGYGNYTGSNKLFVYQMKPHSDTSETSLTNYLSKMNINEEKFLESLCDEKQRAKTIIDQKKRISELETNLNTEIKENEKLQENGERNQYLIGELNQKIDSLKKSSSINTQKSAIEESKRDDNSHMEFNSITLDNFVTSKQYLSKLDKNAPDVKGFLEQLRKELTIFKNCTKSSGYFMP